MRLRALLLSLALAPALPVAALAQGGSDGFDLSSLQLPPGFLQLSDLMIGGAGSGGGVTAFAHTTVGGAASDVYFSTDHAPDGRRITTLALRPDDWQLSRAIPALANTPLDGMTLSNVTLVITDQAQRVESAQLSDEQYAYYRQVYGSDEFTLVLTPGINIIAAIPVDRLPPGHPLLSVMDALGIDRGIVLLQGTLGKSMTMLTGGVSAAALRDVYLRAELPPMRPPGSPDWFRSGQLALEITGEPSIRLVGEMNVLMDEHELQFYLAAMLARSGVSLAGGMRAPEPWVAPFGIEWLTMKSVVLQIGITPTGVLLGFGGAAVIGEKDIDVAVATTLSPVGVPTNFMMRGASEAGVALSDLATVQANMAAARQRAAGATGPGTGEPRIPLDALPDIAIRSLALSFAPQANPELQIERGFKIRGRLWLSPGPNAAAKDFAGVDIGVTDEGLWVRGDLGAFRLGPLTWDDARLDLTATRQEQHLIVSGQVQLGLSRQMIDLYVARDALRFQSETELFGLFHATLNARASFELTNPSFAVDGVVGNDFGEYLQPILRDGIVRFASAGRVVINGAQTAAGAARQALAVQEATVGQLRASLTALRDNAEGNWRAAESRATAALAYANTALRARDAAWHLWDNTSRFQVALRASRYAEYLRLAAVYATRIAQYAAERTAANARRAIYDAIPPVDQSVLLLAAEAATAHLRALLQQAETNLTALANRYDAIIDALDAGADPFSIQYAEFHANLAVVQGGGAMSWVVRGVFVGRPYELHQQLDFSSPVQAVAQLLTGLVGA